MRRALIALMLLLATPALAAEKGDKKETAGQYVDVSTVALPVVWQGKLVNYVFVAIRLNLRQGVDSLALRDKEPYFRDALVRGAHRTPFTDPKSFVKLDEAALKRFMLAASAKIAGPGAVTGVEIVSAQPMKMSGLPKAN